MTQSRTRPWALFLALGFLLPVLPAQQSAPLVRSTTRLVLLDVVVTGKDGTPIRNLGKDDFTVFENGVPQKITSFEAASAAVPATATAVSPAAVTPAPSAAVPPGPSPRLASSRTILLLDQLNTSFADLSSARDNLLRFIDQPSSRNEPMALMSVELPGLVIAQDYTRDHKLLADKLRHLTLVNANSKGNQDIDWALEYAQAALRDLTQIARASIGAPYSVNVIWVTSGFAGMLSSTSRNDKFNEGLRRITDLLIRSRMRLYTIDPAGVVPKIPMGGVAISSDVSHGTAQDGRRSSADQFLVGAGSEAAEANVVLAQMTHLMGGLSFYGRNDIVKALDQAVLDGSSSYLLSYSPADSDFKGEYRKIEVHTTLPGSIARTRPGYYALPDSPAADQQLAEARMEAAMASPLAYSGLEVACPAAFDPQKDRLTGKIVVTPKPLFGTGDTRQQVLRISSYSGNAKPLNVWFWRINWKDPWTNRVVSASFDKVLSPKARRVRFLVADPAADRIGTCDYRLP